MSRQSVFLFLAIATSAVFFPAASTYAGQIFVTQFAKNNDIYTNLNEQFPNTGPGTPGSGVGTANATFLFNPATYTSTNAIANSNLANNGIQFSLTSNAAGQDFEQIDGGTTLTVPVSQNGVTSAYLLMGAYNGQSVNVTFTGSDNSTETFNNISIPDFNGGGPINTTGTDSLGHSSFADQTVFRVADVGAGGTGNSTTGANNNYDLTELSFTLNSVLGGEQLTSIGITSNGFEPLLLGATVVTSVPEPASLALLALGAAALFTRRRK